MKKAKKTALAGILSALTVIILLLGSIFEVLDMSMAAISSFITVLACIELSGKYPLLIYATSSAVSLLLLPNKYGVLLYILFFGYYPIIKRKLDTGVKSKLLRRLIKLLIFAFSMAAVELLYFFVFAVKIEEGFTASAVLFTVAVAVIADAILDIALDRLTAVYIIKWRKYIEKYL